MGFIKKKINLIAVIWAISLYVHFREEFREREDKAEVLGGQDPDKHYKFQCWNHGA